MYPKTKPELKSEIWKWKSPYVHRCCLNQFTQTVFPWDSPCLLAGDKKKSLFSWSHPSCSFLAHQQTSICSFDCCHFTDGCGLHLSCISCTFNNQLPLEKSRSQWATWHQVDNQNTQAVALPGRAASAKSLANSPSWKDNLRFAVVPTDQEQIQGPTVLYKVFFLQTA